MMRPYCEKGDKLCIELEEQSTLRVDCAQRGGSRLGSVGHVLQIDIYPVRNGLWALLEVLYIQL